MREAPRFFLSNKILKDHPYKDCIHLDNFKSQTSQAREITALLMKEELTAILVIDVQDKLIRPIENNDAIINNIRKILDVGNILKIDILFSEQNPKKLGSTVNVLCEKENTNIYSKMTFSSFECKQLMKVLRKLEVQNVLLCGIETHICVQQTALDLISAGMKVYIPIDATGSQNSIDCKTAIRRLEFAGAIISTTEAIIFEWCRTADRLEFKQISEIVKRKRKA